MGKRKIGKLDSYFKKKLMNNPKLINDLIKESFLKMLGNKIKRKLIFIELHYYFFYDGYLTITSSELYNYLEKEYSVRYCRNYLNELSHYFLLQEMGHIHKEKNYMFIHQNLWKAIREGIE